MSELVTDKGRLWSDLGPIKRHIFVSFSEPPCLLSWLKDHPFSPLQPPVVLHDPWTCNRAHTHFLLARTPLHTCRMYEQTHRKRHRHTHTHTHRHSDTRKHTDKRIDRQKRKHAKTKNRPQKALVTHIFDSKKRKYLKIFHNCSRRSSAMASCHYGAPP